MSAMQHTATATPTATAVNEEGILRAYNSRWQDTAAGRATHTESCPAPDHRDCGRITRALRWLGDQLAGDCSDTAELEVRRGLMQDAADLRGAELDERRNTRFEATR